MGLPILQETYAPVIRMKRAARAGDPEATQKYHPVLDQAGGSMVRLLWINLKRPVIMLFTSFICFILSLYMAL